MMSKKIVFIALVLGLCFLSHPALAFDDAIIEVDNHDATYAGAWATSTARILYYGDDYRWAACSGDVNNTTASATFVSPRSLDVDGNYSVFARWVVDPNRSVAARYYIYKDNGDAAPITWVSRDQETKGGEWRYLGTWSFDTGNQPKVILQNNCANEPDGANVIADAVRWVKENIDAGDTVDEPGIEYASASSRDVSTMPTNCAALMNLASFTVSAPAAGYIHVQASGIYAGGASYRWVRVGLDNAGGGGTFSGWAPILESWTNSANAYANEKRYALSRVFYVSASGAYTFYLKGCREDGATGNLMWNDFTGVYYRTRY